MSVLRQVRILSNSRQTDFLTRSYGLIMRIQKKSGCVIGGFARAKSSIQDYYTPQATKKLAKLEFSEWAQKSYLKFDMDCKSIVKGVRIANPHLKRPVSFKTYIVPARKLRIFQFLIRKRQIQGFRSF